MVARGSSREVGDGVEVACGIQPPTLPRPSKARVDELLKKRRRSPSSGGCQLLLTTERLPAADSVETILATLNKADEDTPLGVGLLEFGGYIVVLEVQDGSLAAASGLRIGDLLVSVGAERVHTRDAAARTLRHAVGAVQLKFLRFGNDALCALLEEISSADAQLAAAEAAAREAEALDEAMLRSSAEAEVVATIIDEETAPKVDSDECTTPTGWVAEIMQNSIEKEVYGPEVAAVAQSRRAELRRNNGKSRDEIIMPQLRFLHSAQELFDAVEVAEQAA